jgi:hypothetical protein
VPSFRSLSSWSDGYLLLIIASDAGKIPKRSEFAAFSYFFLFASIFYLFKSFFRRFTKQQIPCPLSFSTVFSVFFRLFNNISCIFVNIHLYFCISPVFPPKNAIPSDCGTGKGVLVSHL